MTFKLGDLIDPTIVQRLALPEDRCAATGKRCFNTKDEARKALCNQHGHRTQMIAFRCGCCEKYHLGHRRGAIL